MKCNSSVEERSSKMEEGEAEGPMAPRGDRRLLYFSDPSSIARSILPDPVEPDDLRRWVDMVADSGADTFVQDVYNQGFTVYWRSDRFQYDQRVQHRRFLPMLDAGIQPLQVLLDHSRQRGLSFMIGFRMNDTHPIGPPPNFSVRADFIESHPEWWLVETREGAAYRQGTPLDFTFDEVREFVFEVMQEAVTHFDVDGLEMTFRDYGYFPFPQGRERAYLMTDLVRRIRGLLDDRSRSQGRRILLGARVFSSLEECLDMGLDVPTWIAEGLLDYVSPEDTMYSDFNAPYAEFSELTRNSQCMLYPGLHPWVSHRLRRKGSIMTPSNQRALAQTFYNGGADGISIYNHFVAHLWSPPFYPQTLQVFHELRDPQRVACGERHYVFDPTWEEVDAFGPDRCSTGAVKAQRVVLDRSAPQPSGIYLFRLYEQGDCLHGATLILRGSLTERDELKVQLNGAPLLPGPLGRADARALERFPDLRWFPVPPAALAYGENQLSITLTHGDPQADGELVIDQVEVWVQPE